MYFSWADTGCVALCYCCCYSMCCAFLVVYSEQVGFCMSRDILLCLFRSLAELWLIWRCRGLPDNEKLPEVCAELKGLWAITYSSLFINCEILHAAFQGFNCSWHYRPIAGGSHLAEMWCFWGYLQYKNLTGIEKSCLQLVANFIFCFRDALKLEC